jgi:hypothetical protein
MTARLMHTTTHKPKVGRDGEEHWWSRNGYIVPTLKTSCADCGRVWGPVGSAKQRKLDWERFRSKDPSTKIGAT